MRVRVQRRHGAAPSWSRQFPHEPGPVREAGERFVEHSRSVSLSAIPGLVHRGVSAAVGEVDGVQLVVLGDAVLLGEVCPPLQNLGKPRTPVIERYLEPAERGVAGLFGSRIVDIDQSGGTGGDGHGSSVEIERGSSAQRLLWSSSGSPCNARTLLALGVIAARVAKTLRRSSVGTLSAMAGGLVLRAGPCTHLCGYRSSTLEAGDTPRHAAYHNPQSNFFVAFPQGPACG